MEHVNLQKPYDLMTDNSLALEQNNLNRSILGSLFIVQKYCNMNVQMITISDIKKKLSSSVFILMNKKYSLLTHAAQKVLVTRGKRLSSWSIAVFSVLLDVLKVFENVTYPR